MTEEGAPLTEVIVDAPIWDSALPDLADIADRAARAALAGAGQTVVGQEIAILACEDARIAELNAQFRGRAAPTNVLSWPAHPLAPPTPGIAPPQAPAEGFLGDLALGYETCAAEAEVAGLRLKDHVFHLILHGCLHLLGFDHETESDARLMEGIERQELRRRGLHDPYAEGDAA